jgi:YD repeat-containing protein
MRRLLYVVLLFAACKSSTKTEKEAKDRLAVVTAQVLEGSPDAAYHAEEFQGDIDQITEISFSQTHLADAYIRKDTLSRTYLFSDGRLYKIISSSRRMKYDTLTIRYDTSGRKQLITYADQHEIYHTQSFRYDVAGRCIEEASRFLSVKVLTDYNYNKTGDTFSIARIFDGNKADIPEQIILTKEGDDIIVKHHYQAGELHGMFIIERYNSDDKQVSISYYTGNSLHHKVITKYDGKGNAIASEYHPMDPAAKDSVGPVSASQSSIIKYQYDGEGNWTSKTEQEGDTTQVTVTKRTIKYQ